MRTALSHAAAAALVPDGATALIGGFMGVGTPRRTVATPVERGARGLTVIADDTARPATLVVADIAVSEPTPAGHVLRETAPGVTVGAVVAATGAPPIVGEVAEMLA